MNNKTQVEINLTAIKYNYLTLKSLTNNLFAVVKTNAYGLGISAISVFMKDFVDGFAVATIDDALLLCELKVNKPILLLTGFFSPTEFKQITSNSIITAITTKQQLDFLLKTKLHQPTKFFLKVDSGMSRLGLNTVNDINACFELVTKVARNNIVLMSHFACSDDKNDKYNQMQITKFNKIKHKLNLNKTSFNNSHAVLNKLYNDDYSRSGIALYGGINSEKLKTVATLYTTLISIKKLNKGNKIGYSGAYVCTKSMTVGIIAIGYGDGLSRSMTDNFVFINDHKAKILGLISMDLTVIDLTNIKANVGDKVEIFGNNIKVYDLANNIKTISYEVFTKLNSITKKYYCRT